VGDQLVLQDGTAKQLMSVRSSEGTRSYAVGGGLGARSLPGSDAHGHVAGPSPTCQKAADIAAAGRWICLSPSASARIAEELVARHHGGASISILGGGREDDHGGGPGRERAQLVRVAVDSAALLPAGPAAPVPPRRRHRQARRRVQRRPHRPWYLPPPSPPRAAAPIDFDCVVVWAGSLDLDGERCVTPHGRNPNPAPPPPLPPLHSRAAATALAGNPCGLNDGGGEAPSPPSFPSRRVKSMILAGTMTLAVLSDGFAAATTGSEVAMAGFSISGSGRRRRPRAWMAESARRLRVWTPGLTTTGKLREKQRHSGRARKQRHGDRAHNV
jgi:hypothetical protein